MTLLRAQVVLRGLSLMVPSLRYARTCSRVLVLVHKRMHARTHSRTHRSYYETEEGVSVRGNVIDGGYIPAALLAACVVRRVLSDTLPLLNSHVAAHLAS